MEHEMDTKLSSQMTTRALVLALTASTDEKAQAAAALAEQFAQEGRLSAFQVEQCKAEALRLSQAGDI